MDKDCLVVKYKKVIDNNNLRKRGVMHINVEHVNTLDNRSGEFINFKIILDASGDFTIRVKNPSSTNEGYISEYDYVGDNSFNTAEEVQTDIINNGSTELNISAGTEKIIYLRNADYTLEITNKYDITRIARYGSPNKIVWYLNLSEINYLLDLNTLSLGNTASVGDLKNLSKLTNLNTVALDGYYHGIYGSIESFGNTSSLKQLYLKQNGNNKIEGSLDRLPETFFTQIETLVFWECDITGTLSNFIYGNDSITTLIVNNCQRVRGTISSLSELPSLTQLDLTGSTEISGSVSPLKELVNLNTLSIAFTGITGSIEEFVDGQILAGRTSFPESTGIFAQGILSQLKVERSDSEKTSVPEEDYYQWITWNKESGNTYKVSIYYGRNLDVRGNTYIPQNTEGSVDFYISY